MRLIVGGDVETTGFDSEKGDRIIEVAFQIWDFDTRRKVKEIEQRINPLRTIPPAATAVHGIVLEDLRECPTWEKVAPIVAKALGLAKVFVAHNVMFDGPFIGLELARIGLEVPNIDSFCTMENGRWATPTGKSPNLGELCWALNVPYDPSKAHAAMYDVDCMMQCLWKGIDLGYYKLPIAA
ncbi:3'-5' exonuclease [Dyella telluris]|uniref:3'-5' exonuclease n=1 Tax=Dyella telluris TaxID=2763498 RepID=A0A7G8Q4M3_9GAMM|nr:3'-5' exonuclease [Dyella telluris]QNK01731.1 3'-5' exonuclease [Dyella telluris]